MGELVCLYICNEELSAALVGRDMLVKKNLPLGAKKKVDVVCVCVCVSVSVCL